MNNGPDNEDLGQHFTTDSVMISINLYGIEAVEMDDKSKHFNDEDSMSSSTTLCTIIVDEEDEELYGEHWPRCLLEAEDSMSSLPTWEWSQIIKNEP